MLVSLVVLLLTAPTASASSEAGWDCAADDAEMGWTVLAAGGSFFPMPPSVPPEGPKVITGWKVKVGSGLGPLPQRLEVFEIQNEENEFEKIGESATETLVEGTNSFPTRIPADEGDSVGLYGQAGTLVCQGDGVSRLFKGSAATGEVKAFEPLAVAAGTPLIVTIEDDRDGDGYGDETQDGCPQGAATQAPCPPVVLDPSPIVLDVSRIVRKRSVLVLVGVSSEAAVRVSGQTERARRLVRPAAQSSRRRAAKLPPQAPAVALDGGSQTVGTGQTAQFNVEFPKPLKRRLAQMKPAGWVKATLTVSATNFAGRTSTETLTVRLPGQKRPQGDARPGPRGG